MCELTDKLRSYHPTSGYSSTMRKAADEIDRLRDVLNESEDLIQAIKDAKGIFALAHDAASKGRTDEVMLHCGVGESRLSKLDR